MASFLYMLAAFQGVVAPASSLHIRGSIQAEAHSFLRRGGLGSATVFPTVDAAAYQSILDAKKGITITDKLNELLQVNSPTNVTGGVSLNDLFGDVAFNERKKLLVTRGNQSLEIYERLDNFTYDISPLFPAEADFANISTDLSDLSRATNETELGAASPSVPDVTNATNETAPVAVSPDVSDAPSASNETELVAESSNLSGTFNATTETPNSFATSQEAMEGSISSENLTGEHVLDEAPMYRTVDDLMLEAKMRRHASAVLDEELEDAVSREEEDMEDEFERERTASDEGEDFDRDDVDEDDDDADFEQEAHAELPDFDEGDLSYDDNGRWNFDSDDWAYFQPSPADLDVGAHTS